MNFDVDRLSRLAGISHEGSKVLSEASNRSYHDEAALSNERDIQHGKNQLSEMQELDRHLTELDAMGEGGAEGPGDGDMEEMAHAEMEEAGHEMEEMMHTPEGHGGGHHDMEEMMHKMQERDSDMYERMDDEDMEEGDGIVLEIDEAMLRQEIRRMRKERLDENRLRSAIRGEIQSIFSDLGIESNSDWVYGENKPKNSKEGNVNLGFLGIGFK